MYITYNLTNKQSSTRNNGTGRNKNFTDRRPGKLTLIIIICVFVEVFDIEKIVLKNLNSLVQYRDSF